MAGILENIADTVRRIETRVASIEKEQQNMRAAVLNWRTDVVAPLPRALLSGDITASADEADIVAGAKIILLTLVDDTWVASGGTFNAERQAIIDGLDSGGSETNGWDAERSNLQVTDVVRSSSTLVTITLTALANYDITAQEVITATVPASALVAAGALVASPTFTIQPVISGSIFTDDFESYANLAAMLADPPNYDDQTQNPGNVITISTEPAHSGTQSVKFTGVSTEEELADKCNIIMDQEGFHIPFSFIEGSILDFTIWYYMEDPGDGLWPSNKMLTVEDKPAGDGFVYKKTSTSGKWRVDRGQFGFSNETPAGQTPTPVGQWIKLRTLTKLGIIPTDDEVNFPNAGQDFYAFDGDDPGWYQIFEDDVLMGQASCTTILSGFTYNITIGFDSVSETATVFGDDTDCKSASGPAS